MKRKDFTLAIMLALVLLCVGSMDLASAANTNAPTSTVKLIFIHHSCGENWLADWDGGLGIALRDSNYFVSDTNYGWGPSSIGDNTDIGNWWDWFRGTSSATYLSALYAESDQNSDYSRLATDPGGENEIIMFKSCYPNSGLGGNSNDPPTTGNNPLRGQDAYSEYMTVANAKGIYNDILTYFATHQDRLFIAITAPPQSVNDIEGNNAANARAFNNWLVNDWLGSYTYNNVAVFDFFNVLTSNGGDANTNDVGQETGNHHRWWNSAVQHIQTVNNDTAAYSPDGWDGHPTSAGNQKATAEFIDLLNIYYNSWQGTGGSASAVPLNVSSIATDLTGPPTAGDNVQITFTVSAQSNVYYRWYSKAGFGTANPGSWQPLEGNWSTNSGILWSPNADNRHIVLAWVAETANSTNFHQAGLTFETQGNSANPIQITGMTTNMTYPQSSGTPITLNTTATGGSGTLYYKYFYRLESGGWNEVGPWNTNGSANWTPTQNGVYTIVVHVSDDNTISNNPLNQAGMTCTIGE